MAPRAIVGIAIVAALVAGCDPLLPPRPETGGSATSVESTTRATEPERGIRLFGPGIARQRQTRV